MASPGRACILDGIGALRSAPTDVIPSLALVHRIAHGFALFACLQGAEDLPAAAEDARSAAEHAFVEIVTARDSFYVHERMRVKLRFGLETGFLRNNVVQMFPQHLDVPAQIAAPWLEDLPGTVAWTGEADESPAIGGQGLTFALDETAAVATRVDDRVVEGRPFTVLEFERSFLPVTAGERLIPPVVLRFAYATRFEEDFLNGCVALDRKDVSVVGGPLVLSVKALPEDGRPLDFHGAVGRFTVRAAASPREVVVGDSLHLQLHVEGEGNLHHFEAPRAPDLEGFHVHGALEDADATHRIFQWDLAPRSETVREVPPISFSFFDPESPAGYHTVHTQPIPVLVHAAPVVPERGQRESDQATATSSTAGRGRKPQRWGLVWSRILFFGVPVVSMFLLFLLPARLRTRARRRSDPDRARARDAAMVFYAGVAEPGADIALPLAEYLAARLRCSTAAVIGSDVGRQLIAAGVPPALAARAAQELESHFAARYGGTIPHGGERGARELVVDLERAFRDAE